MKASVATRRRIIQGLFPALCGAGALALYAATAARWLTWEHSGADGGDLIAAAMTWGIPHPSGYPTYCLLGHAFSLLPLGSIAGRFSLFSATAAALAIALLYLVTLRLLECTHPQGGWLNGFVAGLVALITATSPTLWSQATIAEVYALAAAACALCLFLALRAEPLAHPWQWAMLGVAWGVGLSAHLTLVLMLPGLAIILGHKASLRQIGAAAAGTLLGLGVFFYLPLAARANPPVAWGDPRTWRGVWWLVSGRLYRGYVLALPLPEIPARLGAWARLWSQQFGWPGLALGFVGLWSWTEKGQGRLALGTLLIVAAYAMYAMGYNTSDSYVYLIPSYLVTALWIAAGAREILAALLERPRRGQRAGIMLVLAILVALPLWNVLCNYRALDLSREHATKDWVEATLGQLPQGALLITGADPHTFALDYVQLVERERTDVLVIDGELWYQPWYITPLRNRYPTSRLLREVDGSLALHALVQAALPHQRVYLATPRDDLASVFQVEPRGALWEITGAR